MKKLYAIIFLLSLNFSLKGSDATHENNSPATHYAGQPIYVAAQKPATREELAIQYAPFTIESAQRTSKPIKEHSRCFLLCFFCCKK